MRATLDELPLTRLLNEARQGSRDAEGRVYELVFPHLRARAAAYLRGERHGHTLEPTALVNEAYIKLAGIRLSWRNRAQFFGIAARVMRRLLVDHARSRVSLKRGRGETPVSVSLTSPLATTAAEAEQVLAVDEALQRLARFDQRQSRIVECRFFGGFDVDETARILGVSTTTIKREWRLARAWLYHELASL
jgi:RNA polymerase sigma factor (TIGR02999 family)